ncbi:MAG: HK97 family phage prohead protease [Pseudomonadota bacterium]
MRAPETKFARAISCVSGDGLFCGYASLFGRMDLSGDIVEPGAFSRSLEKHGPSRVGMLLEHDPEAAIGFWLSVEEDHRGLWVEGRLGASPKARDAAQRMAEGRLDGLSIGFRTVRAAEGDGLRRLQEIELWEVSVVMSPMLPEARARAAGADRRGRAGPADVSDAGLLSRMNRTATFLRQMR